MMKKEAYSSRKPTKSIIFVTILWIIQSSGRIVLGYLSTVTPGGLLDVKVDQIIIQTINTMFLLLGVLGLIAAVGLLMMKRWGFWATLFVSILTILFDIWGITIQSSAAIGFIVPAISILILLAQKSKLQKSMR